MGVAPAREMQVEELLHAGAREREAPVELRILEALACPFAQRPAQPAVDRHREALLRPVDDLARQQAVSEAAQQVLAFAAAQLPRKRQSLAPFDQLVVEQGLARRQVP